MFDFLSQPRASHLIFCVGQCRQRICEFSWVMTKLGVSLKPLLGRYDGLDEVSFLTLAQNIDAIRPWIATEESILVLESLDGQAFPVATLRYLSTGLEKPLGRLIPVAASVAAERDAYTYDPLTGNYFICCDGHLDLDAGSQYSSHENTLTRWAVWLLRS